jgi:hypothetical protein
MNGKTYVEPLKPLARETLDYLLVLQDEQLRQELYRQLFTGVSRAYFALLYHYNIPRG